MALPLERVVNGVVAANRMAESALPVPFTMPFSTPPVLAPSLRVDKTDYYRVRMTASTAEIITGYQTPVFAYNGSVPGPTIQAKRGVPTLVRMINQLPTRHPLLGYVPWTSAHLHGSASLPQFDGYASDLTNPGQYKDYRYPNTQHARTMWYHDHGLHHTTENVYSGLFGLYQVTDAAESHLQLPTGPYDVPLILSDFLFDDSGRLLLDTSDDSGSWGDVITVNGRAWPLMPVARRKYRFRIVNGSVSRSYNLSLSTGEPFTVIATDSGLMPQARSVTSLRLGGGERYEIVIDFASFPVGAQVVLRNASPKNNIDYTHTDKVMAFQVTDDAFSAENNELPTVLNANEPTMALNEAGAVATRVMSFHRSGGLWTINGKTWKDVVRSNYSYVLADPLTDTTEIWEFRNDSGGWHHPVHMHFVDFKVLSRNGRPPHDYELGPKDTVYVGEYDRVRVLVNFAGGAGKYMIHCHNMVHEDHDMMGQFLIRAPGRTIPDPRSVKARTLPETGW